MVMWMQEKNIPLAIVTNKPRLYSEALLKQLKLEEQPLEAFTASLVCPDDVTNSKPHPEPLLKACAAMKVPPEKCIYVGDHIRDINAGKAANMKTIAAGFGYVHSNDEALSWQADWTIESSSELLPLLQAIESGKI